MITKDGEVVSQEVDHTVTYKGHAPVILRNTSGTMAPTESSGDTQLIESITDPSNPSVSGPQEGSSSAVVSPDGNSGPGSAPGTDSSSSGAAPGGNSGQRLRRKAAASRFLRLREQRREVQMGQDLQLREAPRCLVRREETEHS